MCLVVDAPLFSISQRNAEYLFSMTITGHSSIPLKFALETVSSAHHRSMILLKIFILLLTDREIRQLGTNSIVSFAYFDRFINNCLI